MAKKAKRTKEEQLAARRASYAAMPADKKAARRAQENAHAKMKRDAETPAQRESRLAGMRERAKKRLLSETPEQRAERLAYLRAYGPSHKAKNREAIKQWSRDRYAKKRQHILTVCKAYRDKNADIVKEKAKQKLKSDPQAAITARLRHRVYLALRRDLAAKHESTVKLVGCSRRDLMSWVEAHFLPGMNWSNRHMWHIDHIVPCSAFDLTDASQQAVAFHYLNLRPAWASDNLSKGDSLVVAPRQKWTLACVAEARRALGLPLVTAG